MWVVARGYRARVQDNLQKLKLASAHTQGYLFSTHQSILWWRRCSWTTWSLTSLDSHASTIFYPIDNKSHRYMVKKKNMLVEFKTTHLFARENKTPFLERSTTFAGSIMGIRFKLQVQFCLMHVILLSAFVVLAFKEPSNNNFFFSLWRPCQKSPCEIWSSLR